MVTYSIKAASVVGLGDPFCQAGGGIQSTPSAIVASNATVTTAAMAPAIIRVFSLVV
jgi:hypothetical protein